MAKELKAMTIKEVEKQLSKERGANVVVRLAKFVSENYFIFDGKGYIAVAGVWVRINDFRKAKKAIVAAGSKYIVFQNVAGFLKVTDVTGMNEMILQGYELHLLSRKMTAKVK